MLKTIILIAVLVVITVAFITLLVVDYKRLERKGKATKTIVLVALVPKVGLEPTRYHYQRILSPSRLPFHHFGGSLTKLIYYNSNF